MITTSIYVFENKKNTIVVNVFLFVLLKDALNLIDTSSLYEVWEWSNKEP